MSCVNCEKKNLLQRGKDIAEGFTNLVLKDDRIEELAKPRLEVCYACPSSIVVLRIGKKAVRRCIPCNCMVEAKARVEDMQCPEGKW